MKKRLIDLRGEAPILDIVSYGRGGPRSITPQQRDHIERTVRRVPEVMIKISGGARTLAGVERHMNYIGREGKLGLETDTGDRLDGKGFERQLIEDWDLDIEARRRQTEHSIRGVRKPPKLVYNIIFSMPPGTPADKVLLAVKKLATNEWAFKHRYAMVLHTDDDHPHVHVVLKAVSEQGERLNIKKATLRDWRKQFASNLRELDVAANATDRAVRGETRTRKSDGIFRANQRDASTHLRKRLQQISSAAAKGSANPEPGRARLLETRKIIVGAWRSVADQLKANGHPKLSANVTRFVDQMPLVETENERLAAEMRSRDRTRQIDLPPRTR
jgi:hypothetical protein